MKVGGGAVARLARWAAPGLEARLRRTLRDRRGAVALTAGVTALFLVGVSGMAVESAYWYSVRRQAQTAADMAAMAGATLLARGLDPASDNSALVASVVSLGRGVANRNGFEASISVLRGGSASGEEATPNAGAVELRGELNRVRASIRTTRQGYISRIFMASDPVIEVSAVAGFNVPNDVCVLAERQLMLSGNAAIYSPCAFVSHALRMDRVTRAVDMNGIAAELDIPRILTLGDCEGANCPIYADRRSLITRSSDPAPRMVTNPHQHLDEYRPSTTPYSVRTVTTGSGRNRVTTTELVSNGPYGPNREQCQYTSFDTSGSTVPPPGVYCLLQTNSSTGALEVQPSLTISNNVRLASGTYTFVGTNIDIKATVSGTNASLVMIDTGSTASQSNARLSITGQGRIDITASRFEGSLDEPFSTRGMRGTAYYRYSRNYRSSINPAGTSCDYFLAGTSSATFNGAFYAPGANLCINGDNTSECGIFVAENIVFQGGASMNIKTDLCVRYGLIIPTTRFVRLLQ